MKDKEIYKTVRKRMKKLREQKKLTQKEFAEIMGWDTSLVTNLENGRVKWTLDKIKPVCETFVIPFNFITETEGEETQLLETILKFEPKERLKIKALLNKLNGVSAKDIQKVIDILSLAKE
jgi:transcriptional regulator with XRE-family HTH domain